MRIFLPIALVAGLAGCGGSATGPVGSACSASSRDAANARLCACIQRVASQTLNSSEQRRAAAFFTAPEKAQEMKARSDSASDAFWRRYKRFASRARASCG